MPFDKNLLGRFVVAAFILVFCSTGVALAQPEAYVQGMKLYGQGDDDSARVLLDAALESGELNDAQRARAHEALAVIGDRAGDKEQAIAHLIALVKLDPAYVPPAGSTDSFREAFDAASSYDSMEEKPDRIPVDRAHAGPTGNLHIFSAPSGARVEVDGKYVGETPILIEDVPANRYALVVFKKGEDETYYPVTLELQSHARRPAPSFRA